MTRSPASEKPPEIVLGPTNRLRVTVARGCIHLWPLTKGTGGEWEAPRHPALSVPVAVAPALRHAIDRAEALHAREVLHAD